MNWFMLWAQVGLYSIINYFVYSHTFNLHRNLSERYFEALRKIKIPDVYEISEKEYHLQTQETMGSIHEIGCIEATKAHIVAQLARNYPLAYLGFAFFLFNGYSYVNVFNKHLIETPWWSGVIVMTILVGLILLPYNFPPRFTRSLIELYPYPILPSKIDDLECKTELVLKNENKLFDDYRSLSEKWTYIYFEVQELSIKYSRSRMIAVLTSVAISIASFIWR